MNITKQQKTILGIGLIGIAAYFIYQNSKKWKGLSIIPRRRRRRKIKPINVTEQNPTMQVFERKEILKYASTFFGENYQVAKYNMLDKMSDHEINQWYNCMTIHLKNLPVDDKGRKITDRVPKFCFDLAEKFGNSIYGG